MSRNYYSEINLHLTWHTKASLPLLTPKIEALTHRHVEQRLINVDGVYVHQIGGIETHMHVVVTVPPTITISELVGQLKGATSHEVNRQMGHHDKTLQWQTGYGVVSFGAGDLPWVKAYVRDQRRHHASGTIHDRLERYAALEQQAETP